MPMKKIFARQIFDSRGNPTVEVDLTTELGLFRAAVPSGASTGIYEALELRDNVKGNWHGKGVMTAISHINDTIAPALLTSGLEVTQQTEIDEFMIKLDELKTNRNSVPMQFLAFPWLFVKLALPRKECHYTNTSLI